MQKTGNFEKYLFGENRIIKCDETLCFLFNYWYEIRNFKREESVLSVSFKVLKHKELLYYSDYFSGIFLYI